MTLLPLVAEYVKAKNLKEKTAESYLVSMTSTLKAFLLDQYGTEDIELTDINLPLMYRYEMFLNTYVNPRFTKSKKKLKAGSAMLYRDKLAAVVGYAAMMEYLPRNPFEKYVNNKILKQEEPKTIERILSPQELIDMEERPIDITKFENRKLVRPRLLFLFQSWTGFAFIDMYKINIKLAIQKDLTGKETIFYNRSKNGVLGIIPMFPQTKKILEELNYDINPGEYDTYNGLVKHLLGYYQVTRANLLGTHTGRHAFGERMLHMGFQMSDVSRMMAHKSIAETEKVYAKVDHTKIWASYDRIIANTPSNPTTV